MKRLNKTSLKTWLSKAMGGIAPPPLFYLAIRNYT